MRPVRGWAWTERVNRDSLTREIARTVTEASQGTQEVSLNISGVSIAANETGQGANETLLAAKNLGTQSHSLSREVDRFVFRIRQG
ncbi:MAG: hypothetical protein WCJ64_27080 [Rhodospirillaceae bacterium]